MSRRSRGRRRSRTGEGPARPSPSAVAEPVGVDCGAEDEARDLTPDPRRSYDRAIVTDASSDKRGEDRSFGQILRRERELRRISLREVAEATKINIRYLEALERNEFTYLPAGAFTRGFIRSYARHIGLDETEMINAYLYELQRQEESGDPPTAGSADQELRVHFGLAEREAARRRRIMRWVISAGGALVLLAVLAALAVFVVSQARGAAVSPPASFESRLP